MIPAQALRATRERSNAGLGGSPLGALGHVTAGQNGSVDTFTVGVGGGIATFGNTTIDNTMITGNTASTNDNDVDGTINT